MKTVKISDKFHFFVAKSKDTKDYEQGETPFVTSAESNNGVVRCVEPLDGDRVFDGPCVVTSGLGFATFQSGQFLPKGNGGDSCTVLYAIEKFSYSDYLSFAATFNALHKWRFSYGRKCSKARIMHLEVPWPLARINLAWEEGVQEIGQSLTTIGKIFDSKTESILPDFAAQEEAQVTEETV